MDNKTQEKHILYDNAESVLSLLHYPVCDFGYSWEEDEEKKKEEEDYMWRTRRNECFSALSFTELLEVCTEVFGLFHCRCALQKCLPSDSALEREHLFPSSFSSTFPKDKTERGDFLNS